MSNVTHHRRLLLVSLLLAWVGLVIACGGLTPEQKAKLDAEAKAKSDTNKRMVEKALANGNEAEARTWIKRGLDEGLNLNFDSPAAKTLLANIQQELAAQKAEQRANAKAEAERRAAEEAAKPGPTRANYNKIQNGMSLAEVQAILGPGRESASGPGVQVVTWQSDGLFTTIISVTFQNNQAQAKAIAP